MTGSRYAQTEFERKFLVRSLPEDLDAGSYVRIVDRYLQDTRLRLRRMEKSDGRLLQYKLGQKFPQGDGVEQTRSMTNIYLDAGEYALLRQLGGLRLEKHRARYAWSGHNFSVDIFQGPLSGLVLAEIEKLNLADLIAVPVPDFAVREVTGEPSMEGGTLARHGLPAWLDLQE